MITNATGVLEKVYVKETPQKTTVLSHNSEISEKISKLMQKSGGWQRQPTLSQFRSWCNLNGATSDTVQLERCNI
ncbi:unnamed protein product [Anisakis simplex]|uniref:Lipoprotein n=1 Tax=Anisakis simplex TaxID=6269 RepID=A0A0M3JQT7_ANISI|nr:unnamed protein product [Anisakis simplex]